MSAARRALVLIAWLLALAALAAALQRAWTSTACVGCVPSYDVADYLNRALDLREAAAEGALLSELLTPNLHPPGHPALLAGSMSVMGLGLPAAMKTSMAVFALALAALVWLGHVLDPARGRWAGLLAALVTATSVEHVRLAAAPMTENLALALTALALGLGAMSLNRPSRKLALAAGLAVSAAALVRYNLAPMLLVPLGVAWCSERAAARGGLLDPRPALWLAPTLLLFGAWQLAEPGLLHALEGFATNVDSGLPTWSADNLLWVPRTFAAHYAHSLPIAAGTGLLALAGLAVAWRPSIWPEHRGTRLLHLFVLIGLTAITLHPYKLTRVLHGTLPFLSLSAALALLRLPPLRSPRATLAGATLGLLLAGAFTLSQVRQPAPPEDAERPEITDRPGTIDALNALATQAAGAERVVLLGTADDLSEHTLRLHLRAAVPGVELLRELAPAPPCLSEPPAQASPDCQPQASARVLRDPDETAKTVWLVMEARGRSGARRGGAKRRPDRVGTVAPASQMGQQHWSVWSAAVFEAMATPAGVGVLEEVPIPGKRGRARGTVKVFGADARAKLPR